MLQKFLEEGHEAIRTLALYEALLGMAAQVQSTACVWLIPSFLVHEHETAVPVQVRSSGSKH